MLPLCQVSYFYHKIHIPFTNLQNHIAPQQQWRGKYSELLLLLRIRFGNGLTCGACEIPLPFLLKFYFIRLHMKIEYMKKPNP